LCALSVFALGSVFVKQMDVMTVFGTRALPDSDALVPWLDGAIRLLLLDEAPVYLYRPTWGLLLATSANIGGTPQNAPWVFLITGGVLACLALFLSSPPIRIAFVALVIVVVGRQAHYLDPLNFGALTPDFIAFALTACGTLLILAAVTRLEPLTLAAGFLTLGLAAVIRGPMLLGGLAIVGLLLLNGLRTRRMWPGAVALLFFAVPLALEGSLQNAFGTVNNGMASLYCVYSHPAHTWNSDCHADFLQAAPTTRSILEGLVSFATSGAGARFYVGQALGWTGEAASQLLSLPFLLAVIVAATGRLYLNRRGRCAERSGTVDLTVRMALLGMFLGMLSLLEGPARGAATIMWLLILIGDGIRRSHLSAAICFTLFLTATGFLTGLSLIQYDRLMATVSFLLPLGLLLAICDDSEQPRQARTTGPLSAANLAIVAVIALLLLGSRLPSTFRTSFETDVRGQSSAIKLSEDPSRNRALYLTGEVALIYTESDATPIGGVRTFARVSESSDPTAARYFDRIVRFH
jgi:hypothetical protein